MRNSLVALTICGAFAANAMAQTPVKIGILEDMSGFYSDITGVGSVIAAQLAVEDFGPTVLGRQIELVQADHQGKADIGSTIARGWYDTDGVDMITGLGNSAVALAVRALSRERGKIDAVASAGVSALTDKACSPTGFHWVFDSFSLAKGLSRQMVSMGGDSWFYLTADYAWGHTVQAESTRFVTESGGKVVGAVRIPTRTTDFSSYLLQAQAAKAKVIGLASAGEDTTNAIKQAAEFNVSQSGQSVAALAVFISDIHSLGLDIAQNLYLSASFYWDTDERTRAWSARFHERHGRMPTMAQAGVYSAVHHYLQAIKAAETTEPAKVAAQMRSMPVNDFWSDNVRIREDGRVMRPMHLFRVKKPEQSTRPWDYYELVATVPGEEAFKPLSESECPLVK
jgi:branched-chain amino acid transport system substrate-binding protein